ncbi:MAG: hypothetical protein HYV42_01380 [Candidatus Magasanikbacteria bacterium]|nr:hypothetical protein [Candidatus Magasanikbacteria bacterium]
MRTFMDDEDGDRPSRSSRAREAERDVRARLTDQQKIEMWVTKHQSTVGLQQLPGDVQQLLCGHRRLTDEELQSLSPAARKRFQATGLRVKRSSVDEPWRCAEEGCGVDITITGPLGGNGRTSGSECDDRRPDGAE